MVSTTSLLLFTAAVAPAIARTAPTEIPAPPVVGISGESAAVPNTVPAQIVGVQNGKALSMIEGTYIQFWKDPNFRGETITTILDRGPEACYSFRGSRWGEWNNAISSLNVLDGGPCWLYDGLACNVSSIGPVQKGNPIPDLGVYAWAKKASSIKCRE